jgi:hypothetical protein
VPDLHAVAHETRTVGLPLMPDHLLGLLGFAFVVLCLVAAVRYYG